MEIIVGAAVSLGIQFIKKYAGTSSWVTYFLVLVASLGAAVTYWLLQETNLLTSIVEVLSGAGLFYTFIITRLEK